MQRLTVFISAASVLLAAACGTPSAATPAAPSNAAINSTADTIPSNQSNIGAKGVSKNITSSQQGEAQSTVNQLVNAINQLH